MTDIMLDLEKLKTTRDGLKASVDAFNDASDINDDLEDAIDSPDDRDGLRDKASDFESKWDGKRDKLKENLETILDQLKKIIDGWDEWDTRTAKDLENGGNQPSTPNGPR